MRKNKQDPGFTIVELLVVIVVIGILASITIISFTGVSQKATAASLQSDLSGAKTKLQMYQVEYGSYPLTVSNPNGDGSLLCPLTPVVDNKYCVKASPGNSFPPASYSGSATTFSLNSTKSSTTYQITESTAPLFVVAAQPQACPTNFITVPGSVTYGTSDFCVMKYEARQVGATNVPISQATGLPWVSISQTDAILRSQSVDGCTGCHLITESEWMTIAQNALSVASNWSGGSVGNGYIYSGHNDSLPAGMIAADSDDINNYVNTGNSSMSGDNQRRTLTLSNGEVIWDFAGNASEWTQGVISGGQAGLSGEIAYSWKEWNSPTILQNSMPNNAMPQSVNITGSSSWSSAQGIGWLYSNPVDVSTRGYLRGGNWAYGSHAGVLAIAFPFTPSSTGTTTTFRVAK